MMDEDYAYEQWRQKLLDQGEVKMERTPEEQAAHDKDMKERADMLLQTPLLEVHAQAAVCLADLVRAVVDGRLKPEDIPPTADELLVVTYRAIARNMLDMKIKGMLSGRG
jgi:hypothetical protein